MVNSCTQIYTYLKFPISNTLQALTKWADSVPARQTSQQDGPWVSWLILPSCGSGGCSVRDDCQLGTVSFSYYFVINDKNVRGEVRLKIDKL